MLTPDQEDRLLVSLFATAEAMGHELTQAAALMMVDDLKGYPEPVLVDALQACRRELTGKLTLAAILQRVQAADGRPARDEAWSIALAASDEFESVMLTDEILAALQAARPSLEARDKVGARMSFLSAYDRLLEAARREGKPANWQLSIGYDPQRRAAAVEQAVLLQRLPAPVGQQLLADLREQGVPVSQDGAAIAGLLTGRTAAPSPEIRQRLIALKEGLEQQKRDRAAARRAELAHYGENLKARRVQLMAQAKGAKRD